MSEDKKAAHEAELTQKEAAAVAGGIPPLVDDQNILDKAGIKGQKTERLPSGGNKHGIV